MSNKSKKPKQTPKGKQKVATHKSNPTPIVHSLLDSMVDGEEYHSIAGILPADHNLVPDIQRAIVDLEEIRGRRCLCYFANVIKSLSNNAISPSDHLLFSEMIDNIPSDVVNIDIVLVTPGGQTDQVPQFVNLLRPRFDSVEFILPYKAMSAGTLWALSGDKIWMDRRACIGPVDPQIISSHGILVPAQGIFTLLDDIQKAGEQALESNKELPWSFVRLLDKVDQYMLGYAQNATNYILDIVSEHLEKYKFRDWTHHSTNGSLVTPEDRRSRAEKVARKICDHHQWKSHSHAIHRDLAEEKLELKIEKIESVQGLEKAVRRLWALCYYIFDMSNAAKIIISKEYSFVRNAPV